MTTSTARRNAPIMTAATAATDEDCRTVYRNALRGLTYDNATKDEAQAAIKAELDNVIRGVLAMARPENFIVTPRMWAVAAERATVRCKRCAGTGQFITGSVNGQPTGPGGDCFRCQGKGRQNGADGHRNRVHVRHYVGRMAFA